MATSSRFPSAGGAVAHLIDPAPHGGAEAVVEALCVGSKATGRAVRAVLLSPGAGDLPLGVALRDAGIPTDVLTARPRDYFGQIAEVMSHLQREVRLVHTHVYHANFVGWRAARRLGIPVVSTVHGFTGGSWRNRLYERLDGHVLRRVDRVVCVSAAVRDELVRRGGSANRLDVVTNGVVARPLLDASAARRALDLPSDVPIVGWIGRLSAEKGPDVFVEVMRRVAAACDGAVLGVVLGDGPERAALASRIAASDAPVRLLGARTGAAQFLHAFDVLAMTSRTEGTPMVLLEAMLAGRPVVAFPVGGIPAVLDDSAGWMPPAGDAEACAEAVLAVLRDPNAAAHRARVAARRVADRFGIERTLDALDDVYARAAAASPR